MRNSFRSLGVNEQCILETWNVIHLVDNDINKDNYLQNKRRSPENEIEEFNEYKKIKLDDVQSEIQPDFISDKIDSNHSIKFNWFETIKQLVLNEKTYEIKFKKLKKKVRTCYNLLNE